MPKILIAGDFCPEGFYVNEELYRDEQMAEAATSVAEITANHQISVVNVETVYSDSNTPIPKSGPNLKSSIQTLEFLKRMRFSVAACANNHIGDYGETGVLDTLKALQCIGMTTVGAGEDAEDAGKVCYIGCEDMTVALINCCEHEFGTARKGKAGAAAMDWYKTGKQIAEAREKADAVIVYLHGGNEYNPVPRPGMKKLCHYFAECGATAVVVGHSHCPQGIEIYKGVPIAYGIGNFYFPRMNCEGMWNSGYMVSLYVEKGAEAVMEIIPYVQKEDATGIRLLKGQEKADFLNYMDCISGLMNWDEIYEKLTLAWCSMYMQEWGKDYLNDGPSENMHELRTLIIRNLFTCESHNELIKTYYDAFCEGRIDESLEPYCEMIRKLQKGIAF